MIKTTTVSIFKCSRQINQSIILNSCHVYQIITVMILNIRDNSNGDYDKCISIILNKDGCCYMSPLCLVGDTYLPVYKR